MGKVCSGIMRGTSGCICKLILIAGNKSFLSGRVMLSFASVATIISPCRRQKIISNQHADIDELCGWLLLPCDGESAREELCASDANSCGDSPEKATVLESRILCTDKIATCTSPRRFVLIYQQAGLEPA